MFKTIPLIEAHLEDAALLVSNRDRRLCEQETHLPQRYADVSNLLPLLRNILNASRIGEATFQGDWLAGFLTGWIMPSFRGKRSTYSPEWANAANLEDSAHIEEMYGRLSAIWLADKYIAHYISLFPNDVDALGAWNWAELGFMARIA